MRRATLIKLIAAFVAVGLFAVLFIRSAKNVGSEPYTLARSQLAGWTVAVDPAARTSGVLLALWPPATFAPPLFSQIFARSGLSLSGPNPVSMPLVLQAEYERALGGPVTADALASMARDSGLESIQPKPLCLASRRISEPGVTREVYFVRFEHGAFEPFRQKVAATVRDAAGTASTAFDPSGLSPVVVVAATDDRFSSWLPLNGSATDDCLAPLTLQ